MNSPGGPSRLPLANRYSELPLLSVLMALLDVGGTDGLSHRAVPEEGAGGDTPLSRSLLPASFYRYLYRSRFTLGARAREAEREEFGTGAPYFS